MKRFVFPLVLGVVGVAILLSLALWQLRRLEWKETMLAGITAQIHGPVQPLPPKGADTRPLKYTPVELVGGTTGDDLLVLSGQKGVGAGYRVISAFETGEGRMILLDRGFLPEADKSQPRPPTALIVQGNIHYPNESDRYTPEPDLDQNLWFARDIPSMAARLKVEPILVVAAQVEGDTQGISPQAISISGIPNDHKMYAITWFLLAIVWSGMTALLLWRNRR
ncbi:SURF1 family protein [Thioclava sp. SK-1]|uniref:SURF1 family protein n=1 Tax=Thioclava sp. SK-1 TaxID=1889770 RepID=UPI00114CB175